MKTWIGVDLDGTLSEYSSFSKYIGAPIPKMVEIVREWVANGVEVKIFTARVSPVSAKHNRVTVQETIEIIEKWLLRVFGYTLPITCEKDFLMIALWDDMALTQIKRNTGEVIYDGTVNFNR